MEDSRLSNLGGVYIKELKVQEPPFDNSNIVQEFVGDAWFKDYMYEPASEVTGERVAEFVETSVDRLNTELSRVKVQYDLLIRARSERGVRAKARTYIRLVNPFSAGVIHIEKLEKTDEFDDLLADIDPLQDFYTVRVFVAK